MAAPQDWAPYSRPADAANVYARDTDLVPGQLRGFVDCAAIQAFIKRPMQFGKVLSRFVRTTSELSAATGERS